MDGKYLCMACSCDFLFILFGAAGARIPTTDVRSGSSTGATSAAS